MADLGSILRRSGRIWPAENIKLFLLMSVHVHIEEIYQNLFWGEGKNITDTGRIYIFGHISLMIIWITSSFAQENLSKHLLGCPWMVFLINSVSGKYFPVLMDSENV